MPSTLKYHFPLYLTMVFWLFSITVKGQSIKKVGTEFYYGFIIPHAADLVPVSQNNPFGMQLEYKKMGLSQSSWEVCNCFHYLGVSISNHQFDNPEVLGSASSLSGFFEPVLLQNERWEIGLRNGMGISYLSKVYDEVNNPGNKFFSNPVSFLLYVQPRATFFISDNWETSFSLTYNHISNGGQSQPNRGMNFPTINLGTAFKLEDRLIPEFQMQNIPKGFKYFAEVFYTNRENPVEDNRKPSYGLAGGAYYKVGPNNAFGTGLEVNLDRSLAVENPVRDAILTAPFVSHHFLFGKFDFNQRMHYYVNKPAGYQPSDFYQRYLLTYQLSGNIKMGFSLKAHGHVAENMDVRLGWLF